MILPFKSVIYKTFIITVMQLSCINFGPDPEPDAFTPSAQIFVNRILSENPGATQSISIVEVADKFGYIDATGYLLKLNVKDKIVLTNTIDNLRNNGIYRYNKASNGTGSGMVNLKFMGVKVVCDTLDSICIITDSIIALESLYLSWCNLTHFPPGIGKIRTKKLDISWNKGLVLAEEITQMDSLPQPFDTLDVDADQTWNSETFDFLPEWAKNWLSKHNF